MKSQTLIPALSLLLLTASVSCQEIKVKNVPDGIEVTCTDRDMSTNTGGPVKSLKLAYKDENTGEYQCLPLSEGEPSLPKIYVKFRTCDNCIEMDLPSIIGIAVGNVLATLVIGVAVYLLASSGGTSPLASHKKDSGRQPLIPNGGRTRSDDPYQSLNFSRGQQDTYDKINKR